MNILRSSTSFFVAELLRSQNSPLIVLRKSQRGATPDFIPSLPQEVINSAHEIGSGGVLTKRILFPAQISALISGLIFGGQGIGLANGNTHKIF